MLPCLSSLWRSAAPPHDNQDGDSETKVFDTESHKAVLKRDRQTTVLRGICGFLAVAVIYLLSELLIWGFSFALAPAQLQFFSSVFGMLLVFTIMLSFYCFLPRIDNIYGSHIKGKVDFINRHMGAGFAIPTVMLNGQPTMNPRTIGLIIGAFVASSLVSWTAVYMLARITHLAITRLFNYIGAKFTVSSADGEIGEAVQAAQKNGSESAECTSASSTKTVFFDPVPQQPVIWTWLCQSWVIIASFLGIFAIGVPLAVVVGDPRILDGCVLWFVWMSAITLQRSMKQHVKSYLKPPRSLTIATTLANPTLLTILLMTAYVRAKAYGMSKDIHVVLAKLSSGTQLYTIWTDGVRNMQASETHWFGAGDAALSVLGCGFVVWGFKLYECRRQLFSAAGVVTVLVSTAAAAGNVFLVTRMAFLMGLARPEALAFAGRVTTLALAIPATTQVGGNTSLTVALVIVSGIIGQLACPSSLHGPEEGGAGGQQLRREPSARSCDSAATPERQLSGSTITQVASAQAHSRDQDDGVDVVSAGIAFGINGAAMGVAHLYENKSRSAPYAALAMTTYGVFAVVFTAMHPFKDTLLSLV